MAIVGKRSCRSGTTNCVSTMGNANLDASLFQLGIRGGPDKAVAPGTNVPAAEVAVAEDDDEDEVEFVAADAEGAAMTKSCEFL